MGLIRKLAILGKLFDLKLEEHLYIGCYVAEEKSVEYLQIKDLLFEYEIKIEYLKRKKMGEGD